MHAGTHVQKAFYNWWVYYLPPAAEGRGRGIINPLFTHTLVIHKNCVLQLYQVMVENHSLHGIDFKPFHKRWSF